MAGLKQAASSEGRCRVCRYRDVCGGNTRVRAFQITGDPWWEDPACYLDDEELGISPADYADESRSQCPWQRDHPSGQLIMTLFALSAVCPLLLPRALGALRRCRSCGSCFRCCGGACVCGDAVAAPAQASESLPRHCTRHSAPAAMVRIAWVVWARHCCRTICRVCANLRPWR